MGKLSNRHSKRDTEAADALLAGDGQPFIPFISKAKIKNKARTKVPYSPPLNYCHVKKVLLAAKYFCFWNEEQRMLQRFGINSAPLFRVRSPLGGAADKLLCTFGGTGFPTK